MPLSSRDGVGDVLSPGVLFGPTVSWQIDDSRVPPQKKNVLLVGIELSETKLCLETSGISGSYCLNS